MNKIFGFMVLTSVRRRFKKRLSLFALQRSQPASVAEGGGFEVSAPTGSHDPGAA